MKDSWKERLKKYRTQVARAGYLDRLEIIYMVPEKEIDSILSLAHQQGVEEVLEKVNYYVDNTLGLLGVTHGRNEMKGLWINYEDLKKELKKLSRKKKI